jgi:hypothetical protein
MRFVRAVALVIVASGCTSGSGEPLDPAPGSGSQVIDEEYPAGPYGTVVGDVIENFEFQGYVDASQGLTEDRRVSITLGDFFNPTGMGTHGDDGPFVAGSPKPKALMINVSAVWCGPCKQEAANILPGEYAHYHPLGLELLMVLADSLEVGTPAAFGDLDAWCSTFPVNYPAVIDPEYQLGGSFDTSQYPANFIVDTATMTIVEVVSGIPQDSFFSKLETVLGVPSEG